MWLLAAIAISAVLARPPAVIYPEFQLSIEEDDFGCRIRVGVPEGCTVYSSFAFDPLIEPDPCSSSHDSWKREPGLLSVELTHEDVLSCLHQDSGGLYAWVSRADNIVSMKKLPIWVEEGRLTFAQDVDVQLSVAELSWAPSGLMILDVGFRSEQTAIVEVLMQSSESLSFVGLTTTANNSAEDYEQHLHFTSEDGAMRENDLVVLRLDNEEELMFTLQLALQDGEVLPDRHPVEMIPFKDAELREPYIASVLGGESIAEGAQVCVLLQDTTGAQIDAGSARICSSPTSDLTLSLACTASQALDLISLEIFNRAEDYLNEILAPKIIDSPSRSQAVFCFSPIKLSDRVHILEVDLDTAEGQLTRRSFEWHGNHSDGLWFHCADGYHWNPYFYQCRADGWWNTALLWGALALVVLVLLFGAMLYYANGHWLGGHEWESPHHGKRKVVATGTVSTTNVAAGLTTYVTVEIDQKRK